MVLGSPSAALANKLVFWSPEDSAAPNDEPAVIESSAGPSTETGAALHDGVSMYVKVFEEMLKDVLSGEGKLFTEEELDCFMKYHRLPYAAKYLFCRLCLRKADKWHRLSALKYQAELGDGIRDAVDVLCGRSPAPAEEVEEEDVKPVVGLNINLPDLLPNFRFAEDPQVKPDPDADPETHAEVKLEVKPEVKEDVKPEIKTKAKPEVKAESKPRVKRSPPRSPSYPVIKEKEREVIDLTFEDEEEQELEQAQEQSPQAGPSRTGSPEYDIPSPSSTPKVPDFSVFADDEEQASLLELLDCLNADELADIAKQLKLKLKSKKRDILTDSILRSSSTQGTLAFPVVDSRKGKEKMVQSTLPFAPAPKGKPQMRQSVLPFKPELPPHKTQQDRVRVIVMKKLEKCIRLNSHVVALFRRANLVYFRSTQHTPDLLTPAVLARARKWTYASYQYARTTDIWRSRAELLAYEDALKIEAEVDELLDGGSGWGAQGRGRSTASRTPAPGRTKTPITPRKGAGEDEEETVRVKNARAVKEIVESAAYPQWKALIDTKPEPDEDGRRNALQRFECGHILTRVVCKGAHALGLLHEYEAELALLDALLAQTRWRRARRGRWHDRRAMLLMHHFCKAAETPEQVRALREAALDGVADALTDPDTHTVFRPMLERRLTTLEKRLGVPDDEKHRCEGEQREAEHVFVEGIRVDKRLQLDAAGRVVNDGAAKEAGGKAATSLLHFLKVPSDSPRKRGVEPKPEKAGGKSVWEGRDGDEVSVEILALQDYEKEGYKGFHCEGRIVTTLFGLLFWDVIFAPIPGAFETRYQSAPLDLAEDTFYYARQPLADARLADIKAGRAAEILEAAYDEHQGKMCVGVRWDLFPKEDLLGIVKGLDSSGLAVICRLMCEEYAARTGGVPDLILWREEKGKAEAKFVEVKGPNDTLQENQKVWIDVLSRAGIVVEVCHVHEPGCKPKIKVKSKAKKTPKKTPSKHKAKSGGKKRKRGSDEDEESLPQFVGSDDETTDYDQLDVHTEDEVESPVKKRPRRNVPALPDEPQSPTAQKVARMNSQSEDVEMG